MGCVYSAFQGISPLTHACTQLQRVRAAGKASLVDAYAKYLGRHRALSACMSNEVVRCLVCPHTVALAVTLLGTLPAQMLSTATSPSQVEACFKALAKAVGDTAARAVCQREPSVLYQKPETIVAVCTSLTSALGPEGAAYALCRNPTLMQPNRDSHVAGALDALATVFGGDTQIASQLAQRNTLLLGTRPGTIIGAFKALVSLFGHDEALQMAGQHPGLLRSMPTTMKAAVEELAGILGSVAAAHEAVRQNSALLKARRVTLRGSFEMLCTLFGKQTALSMVHAQLGLLRSRAATLKASHDAIVGALGPEVSPIVMASVPVLLQCRDKVIEYNWNALSSTVGIPAGRSIAAAAPHSLTLRLGRLPELLALLVDVFGSPDTLVDAAHPQVFKAAPAQVANRWGTIVRMCGGDEATAKAAVIANSRLLTCSDNVLESKLGGGGLVAGAARL